MPSNCPLVVCSISLDYLSHLSLNSIIAINTVYPKKDRRPLLFNTVGGEYKHYKE